MWLLILLANKHGVIIIATILHHDNFVLLWHIVFVCVCCRYKHDLFDNIAWKVIYFVSPKGGIDRS